MILFSIELGLGFVSQILLALLTKAVFAHRQFPAFYFWLIFEFAKTSPLLALYHFGTQHQYFVVYWCVQVVNYLFQVAICFNVFTDACQDPERREVVAIGLIWIVLVTAWLSRGAPVDGYTGLLAVAIRLSRGTSVGLCLCFGAVLLALHLAHVKLRVRGRGIIAGLGIYAGGELAYSALFGIFGLSYVWCIHFARLAYFVAVYVWADHLRRVDQPLIPSKESVRRLLERMRELLSDTKLECSDL